MFRASVHYLFPLLPPTYWAFPPQLIQFANFLWLPRLPSASTSYQLWTHVPIKWSHSTHVFMKLLWWRILDSSSLSIRCTSTQFFRVYLSDGPGHPFTSNSYYTISPPTCHATTSKTAWSNYRLAWHVIWVWWRYFIMTAICLNKAHTPPPPGYPLS
jgi:hypothetical protein